MEKNKKTNKWTCSGTWWTKGGSAKAELMAVAKKGADEQIGSFDLL